MKPEDLRLHCEVKGLPTHAWLRSASLGAKIFPHSSLRDLVSRSFQEALKKWHPPCCGPLDQNYGNKTVGPTGSYGACHSLGPDLFYLLSATEHLFSLAAFKPKDSTSPDLRV